MWVKHPPFLFFCQTYCSFRISLGSNLEMGILLKKNFWTNSTSVGDTKIVKAFYIDAELGLMLMTVIKKDGKFLFKLFQISHLHLLRFWVRGEIWIWLNFPRKFLCCGKLDILEISLNFYQKFAILPFWSAERGHLVLTTVDSKFALLEELTMISDQIQSSKLKNFNVWQIALLHSVEKVLRLMNPMKNRKIINLGD